MKSGRNNLKDRFLRRHHRSHDAGRNVERQQKSKPAKGGFSFDVYGDSRSMMYLPYKQSEEAEARQLMVDMFELVLPEKVSAAMVKGCQADLRPVKQRVGADRHAVHDRQRGDHTDVGQGLGHGGFGRGRETASGSSPHDVPLGGWRLGCARSSERNQERKRKVSSQHRRPSLVGQAGNKPSENPYWKLVNEEVLKQLPNPDKEMKSCRIGWARIPRRRKPRSVGRLRR